MIGEGKDGSASFTGRHAHFFPVARIGLSHLGGQDTSKHRSFFRGLARAKVCNTDTADLARLLHRSKGSGVMGVGGEGQRKLYFSIS